MEVAEYLKYNAGVQRERTRRRMEETRSLRFLMHGLITREGRRRGGGIYIADDNDKMIYNAGNN